MINPVAGVSMSRVNSLFGSVSVFVLALVICGCSKPKKVPLVAGAI